MDTVLLYMYIESFARLSGHSAARRARLRCRAHNIVKATAALAMTACYRILLWREDSTIRVLYGHMVFLTIVPSALFSSGSGACIPTIPWCLGCY